MHILNDAQGFSVVSVPRHPAGPDGWHPAIVVATTGKFGLTMKAICCPAVGIGQKRAVYETVLCVAVTVEDGLMPVFRDPASCYYCADPLDYVIRSHEAPEATPASWRSPANAALLEWMMKVLRLGAGAQLGDWHLGAECRRIAGGEETGTWMHTWRLVLSTRAAGGATYAKLCL